MKSSLSSLRIAFLAGTLGQGGAERQLYYILRTLCSAGAQVSLLSLTRGEFWEKPIRKMGIPVVWVGDKENNFVRLAKIIQCLRKSNVSILQSHHFYTNPYAALAGKFLGLQTIGAIRNDAISEVRANGRVLGTLCLRTPQHLAANSLMGKRNAEALGVCSSKISFLPNVVDTAWFHPVPRQGNSAIRILTIGRLEKQKNQRLFLAALAQLRDAIQLPVLGMIAGAGPERKSLETLAQDYGLLPDGVKFLGEVTDPVPLYQAADIFLLTSDWEGTPNVVLEAMACGLPVVATAVGGVPELIQDNYNGCLVTPGDLDALLRTLMDLVSNSEKRKRLGNMARNSGMEKHDLQRLPEILDQFYRAIQ